MKPSCLPPDADWRRDNVPTKGRQDDQGSNERECGQAAVKPRRQVGQSAAVFVLGRGVVLFEIPPTLMPSPWTGRNQNQFTRADDVDPAVTALLEPQDFLAADEPVLDDPV